ncbi:MAG: hypothetical protein QM758_06980 [Armatimonas sp.]
MIILVRSCVRCSIVSLYYAREMDKIFKPKGVEVVLVTQDSPAAVEGSQAKAIWPSGRIVSDSNQQILQSLGNPDLPQVAAFKKKQLFFTGNDQESLKQSLVRFLIQEKIDPALLDGDIKGGIAPCSAK